MCHSSDSREIVAYLLKHTHRLAEALGETGNGGSERELLLVRILVLSLGAAL